MIDWVEEHRRVVAYARSSKTRIFFEITDNEFLKEGNRYKYHLSIWQSTGPDIQKRLTGIQKTPGENFFPTAEVAKERAVFIETVHQRQREQKLAELEVDRRRNRLAYTLRQATPDQLTEFDRLLTAAGYGG